MESQPTHSYVFGAAFLPKETAQDAYEYLRDNIAIRFAKTDTVIPNAELKFAKNHIDAATLSTLITVQLPTDELIISNLEMQIAFKEEVLKSPKDMEDARHIRNVAKNFINTDLIQEYKRALNEHYGK